MLSGRQIHGLPTYAEQGGFIGEVDDIAAENGKIKGFIINQGSVISRKYFAPLKSVVRLDLTGLYLTRKPQIRKDKRFSNTILCRMWEPVFSSENDEIGTVADVWIDHDAIWGVEISHGLISDLSRRRDILLWSHITDKDGAFILIDDSLQQGR